MSKTCLSRLKHWTDEFSREWTFKRNFAKTVSGVTISDGRWRNGAWDSISVSRLLGWLACLVVVVQVKETTKMRGSICFVYEEKWFSSSSSSPIQPLPPVSPSFTRGAEGEISWTLMMPKVNSTNWKGNLCPWMLEQGCLKWSKNMELDRCGRISILC